MVPSHRASFRRSSQGFLLRRLVLLLPIALIGAGFLACPAGAQPGAQSEHAGVAAGTPAAAAALDSTSPPAGRPAPFFRLPQIATPSHVASDTLFDVYPITVLAFWTTHCAECVRRLEACQDLYDWGMDEGLNVVGINFDDTPSTKIELLAQSATPRVPQLYDAGGNVAAAFGAGAHSFSVYLVDDAGIIRAAGYELSPDSLVGMKPRLSRMLNAAEEEASGTSIERALASVGPTLAGVIERLGIGREERLRVEGVGRVRWMNIDTTGVGATGPNGEAIEPGSTLRHRLELQLLYAISEKLTAGGLLWLSNEGEAVLHSGPDYLSNAWGSAFVRLDTPYDARRVLPGFAGRLSLRAGYYDAYFTPLVLMRYDKDDSPISGGQKLQGCGVCGGEAGVAGFIRSESLEKLAPEYLFEGARLDLSFAGRMDLTALYARPQDHWPKDGLDCMAFSSSPANQGRMRYREHVYAGRLTGNVQVPWTPDVLRLSTTGMLVQDEIDGWPCGLVRTWPFHCPIGRSCRRSTCRAAGRRRRSAAMSPRIQIHP
jgi:peroxiredoxin